MRHITSILRNVINVKKHFIISSYKLILYFFDKVINVNVCSTDKCISHKPPGEENEVIVKISVPTKRVAQMYFKKKNNPKITWHLV